MSPSVRFKSTPAPVIGGTTLAVILLFGSSATADPTAELTAIPMPAQWIATAPAFTEVSVGLPAHAVDTWVIAPVLYFVGDPPGTAAAVDAGVTSLAGPSDRLVNTAGYLTIPGDLVHNGAGIHTPAGSRTVVLGTARGAGTYTGAGTVEYRGVLSPGNSPAITVYGGDLVLGSTATLHIELGGATPGTEHDQVQVGGTAYLDGILAVSLIDSFVPSGGQSFTILTYGTRVGDFAQFTGLSLPNGLTLQPVVTATEYRLVAVPEPLSVLATCAAAAALRFAARPAKRGERRIQTVMPSPR